MMLHQLLPQQPKNLLEILILLITVVLLGIINNYKNDISKWIKDKFDLIFKKKSNISFKDHGVFVYIDEILRVRLNDIDFGDKSKNKLFKDLSNIILISLKNELVKLSETENIDNLSVNNFNNKIIEFLISLSETINNKFLQDFGEDITKLIRNDVLYKSQVIFNTTYIKETIYEGRKGKDTNSTILTKVFMVISCTLKSIFDVASEKYKNTNGLLSEMIKKRYNY